MNLPKGDTAIVVSGQDFETVAKTAAAQAVTDSQELMETAIRTLRDELRGEIRQVVAPNDLKFVKDRVSAMGNQVHALHAVQAKLSQHQVAQWKIASKEQVEKQISDLHVLIKAESARHATKEHVDKQIANLQTRLAQADFSTGAGTHQFLELKTKVQDMHAQLSGRSAQPDSATRGDLEAIRDSMTSLLRAQEVASKEHFDRQIFQLRTDLSQIKGEQKMILSELQGAATKDDVNKQISDLHLHLSRRNSEPVNDNLSEIRGQMQVMQVQLSEHTVACSDLKAFKEGTLLEMREHGKEIKEHVEMKMSGLQQLTSPLAANAQPSFSDLEAMKSQMQQMQKQMSEHNGQSDVENRSAVEAFKHVDEMMSKLHELLYKIKKERETTVLELRETSEATKWSINEQISDLHSHLSEIKEHLAQRTDKSGPFDAEVELPEAQRNLNAFMHEMGEVVDELVNGSSKMHKEWLAKVATLEHDIDELRSEAKSLRIAVREEQWAMQV